MGIRQNAITKSILNAIFFDNRGDSVSLLTRIRCFFSFFHLWLVRFNHELFKSLRTDVWEVDNDEYKESFRSKNKKGSLKAVGDLGYSGSVSGPVL